MIHCIAYRDVEAFLNQEGFVFIGEAGSQRVFENPDRPADQPRFCSIHVPNQHGKVTEASVNDSFYAAGLEPPTWDLTWCD